MSAKTEAANIKALQRASLYIGITAGVLGIINMIYTWSSQYKEKKQLNSQQ